jgi:predicted enzyme related to lactoylglutathione lyase
MSQDSATSVCPIAYFEIAGPDSGVLASFYSKVFGWRTSPGPFPTYYSVAADGGAGIPGGIRQEQMSERVIYIRVSDLQQTLDVAVAAGAKVLIPPTRVPGVVHFALFEDPAGNRTGIVQ